MADQFSSAREATFRANPMAVAAFSAPSIVTCLLGCRRVRTARSTASMSLTVFPLGRGWRPRA
eukprot:8020378-Lingulodinium_polyedra.AAC.1